MRSPWKVGLLCTLLAASGCRRQYVVPEAPLPRNTILLSQMMRQLSAQPGFTEALLADLDNGGKKGPALLTPKLVDELRRRILGSDWQGLDRFPGWPMREINPTIDVAGEIAQHVAPTDAQAREYLDLGPYPLDRAETVSLDQPSTLPPFTAEGIVAPLGDGVVRGDGPNDLAPEHAESQRLADVLNRLAANSLDGAKPFAAELAGSSATNPEQLIAALAASGEQIVVDDARYFANFGHLHYNGQDVMMPFWIDSQMAIPHSHGRHLLVPAAHAELEWHIRGPLVNADVSYYFGIDGKSEWRTMDTLDQPWVLERNAHEYRGAQAVEVTRLAGLLTVAYMHQHMQRPQLPFGGYYALGVCQDGISAIEQRMTGKSTLFPNTADIALFNDPRDAEANALLAAIPKDREGAAPSPERIFGSLPVTPKDFNAITIPGLAADLTATYAAWKNPEPHADRGSWIALVLSLLALLWLVWRARPSAQATKR
jgi:hypothetical protein